MDPDAQRGSRLRFRGRIT